MTTTRFAPSPTGFLHIGGVRTALFSYLYARKNNGKFLLRIEDTDLQRSTQEAVDAILEGMRWLGMENDEQTYYQTTRFNRYNEVVKQLIDEDKAYYCFCSKERLDDLRAEQKANKQRSRYDERCRDLNRVPQAGEDFVVRFKNPIEGEVIWHDAVKGEIKISNKELDDMIIQRTDGSPTYNFCVVVDDFDMGITHIIRGDDHVNNTPKQINIYKSLNAKLPVFAHVPMILGADGTKLSKRHGSVNVMQYREDGYLPQAINNYLVRLGWSHGDKEIFSKEEMITDFDLEHISPSPSRFDTEKLNWLNKHYIRTSDIEEIQDELIYHFEKNNLDVRKGPDFQTLIDIMGEKVNTIVELVNMSKYFYTDEIEFDPKAVKKWFKATTGEILALCIEKIKALSDSDWQNDKALHNVITEVMAEKEVGMGKVGMPMRVATTGSSQSPDIGITLKMIGKDRVIARLELTIATYFA